MCDFDAIRSEYITTDHSLPELGKKHSISLSTLQKRCRKEGWVELRQQYKRDALNLAMENAVADEADRLGKIIAAAQSMANVIEGVFSDPKQFYRHVVQDEIEGEKTTIEKIFPKADSRAVRDMTGALKDMTYVLRNLHNLPTQAEAEAQRIAAERLKLEQRKADAAEKEQNADKTVKVVMANGWEDLAK